MTAAHDNNRKHVIGPSLAGYNDKFVARIEIIEPKWCPHCKVTSEPKCRVWVSSDPSEAMVFPSRDEASRYLEAMWLGRLPALPPDDKARERWEVKTGFDIGPAETAADHQSWVREELANLKKAASSAAITEENARPINLDELPF